MSLLIIVPRTRAFGVYMPCCFFCHIVHASASVEQEQGAKEGRTNEYEELHAAGIDVPGRLTLNLWRLLRSELKLGIYTQVPPAGCV